MPGNWVMTGGCQCTHFSQRQGAQARDDDLLGLQPGHRTCVEKPRWFPLGG
jgi:hypothetical protein